MTSRQQYPHPHQHQHQQQYYPSTQFQEGHSAPSDANEWNTNNDQSRGTSSVSSFKSWTSTDPPQYQAHPRHNSSQLPPRGLPASARNRSNSNASNVSNGFSYNGANANNGYSDYGSNHMSHVSQKSNSNMSYAHSHSPPYHQPHQHYQQQQQQYQGYNNIHHRQDESSFSRGNSNGSNRSDHTAKGSYTPPNQGVDHLQHGKQGNEFYANGSDSPRSSHRQDRQSPTQQDPSISQSLMQSLDQFHNPNGSPRMAARSVPRRREQTQATTTNDGDLPSLDDYEAMLQQMTSPGLGPSSPREARAARRSEKSDNEREARTERRTRQARKQTEQQQQQQQQHGQLELSESGSNAAVPKEIRAESPQHVEKHSDQLSVSSIDKKNRRRSSLPPSFTEFPGKLLTDFKRRSGGYQSSIETVPEVPLHVPTEQSKNRHSWEDDSVVPRSDLIYPKDPLPQKAPAHQDINGFSHHSDMTLLHVDGDGDMPSGLSESAEQQRLDHQRRNKRKSPRLSQLGSKPPLTTRSHLRLSHTLSQSDADEAMAISRSILKDDGRQDMASTSVIVTEPRLDEDSRQIEQFQLELQQLQNMTPSSRHLHSGASKSSANSTSPVAPRSRATTPLGMVAEEGSPTHPAPPSRQQLLASLDGGGPRSTTPTNSRSRPSTPNNGIRPPLGPAPGHGNNSSPSSSPIISRKGSPAMGRRIKPSPPVSSAIQLPITSRPRAGSVASANSANSLSNFNLENGFHYAAPSLPLPSLPPPPAGAPSSSAGEPSSGSHRPRKTSGSKELMIPTTQLLSESGDSASTFELRSELEALRMQLIEKDEVVTRMMMEKQEQENHSKQDDTKQSVILSLETSRSNLERELGSAKDEIDRLQHMLVNQKNVDTAAAVEMDSQERNQAQERENVLVREVESLRAEQAAQQEAYSTLERELEAFTARSQQEDAQYRTLQDTVQRLTSKTSRLEAQHAAEIQQLQQDHEEVMEKIVVEHAEALTDLVEQSKNESEWREDLEKKIQQEKQEKQEALAREKVLNGRLEEQMARNDQLQKEMLTLERAQAAHDEEKETWTRTNKSLERQLMMERMQQAEHLYKIEEVEKETQRLRTILSDLDLSAQFSRDREDGYDREEVHATYETQRQRWMDQIQLLERKMAKTDEDAATIMNKNMELMVALEMAQSAQSS